MNDDERRQWVDNDEGLYDLWRSSRTSMRQFIKDNRALIDEAVGNVTGGKKQAHYLKYDPYVGPTRGGAQEGAGGAVCTEDGAAFDLSEDGLRDAGVHAYELGADDDENEFPLYLVEPGLGEVRRTGRLTRAERTRMDPRFFAIPERRAYPLTDPYHAMLALQHLLRVAGRHGASPSLQNTAERVLAAVQKRYPSVYRDYADLVNGVQAAYRIGRRRAVAAEKGATVKLTPASDPYLFYVAGDKVSIGPRAATPEEAERRFYKEKGLPTYTMGVTAVGGAGYDGDVIEEYDDDEDYYDDVDDWA